MTDALLDEGVYRQVDAILEGRRAKARAELETRRKTAYSAVPELEAIEYKIAETGLKHNIAMVSGACSPEEAGTRLEGEIGALRQKSADLLLSGGFPASYLSVGYECMLCGDTGYTTGSGGARARCGCYAQLLYGSLASASNILAAGDAGFAFFDEGLFSDAADRDRYASGASPRENLKMIRDSAERFVRSFKSGICENLYFFGRPGTGKTFMAASIAEEIMRGGSPAMYFTAPSLFGLFSEHRMRSFRDEGYRDSAYKRIYSCRLLVIDDLGTESLSDARYSEFVELINERLVPGSDRSTIIVSNMGLNDLRMRYDERVMSRIIGSFRIIRFFGEDVRLAKKTGKAP